MTIKFESTEVGARELLRGMVQTAIRSISQNSTRKLELFLDDLTDIDDKLAVARRFALMATLMDFDIELQRRDTVGANFARFEVARLWCLDPALLEDIQRVYARWIALK